MAHMIVSNPAAPGQPDRFLVRDITGANPRSLGVAVTPGGVHPNTTSASNLVALTAHQVDMRDVTWTHGVDTVLSVTSWNLARDGPMTCIVCDTRRDATTAGNAAQCATCYAHYQATVFAANEQHVELKDTGNPATGVGVFVRPGSHIRIGTALGQYIGEISKLPGTRVRAQKIPRSDYEVDFPRAFKIDAATAGGWVRFVNHDCCYNCEFQPRLIGTRLCVVLEAIANIPAGREITVNYGGPWFKDRGYKCKCTHIQAPRPGAGHAVYSFKGAQIEPVGENP
jgi:hypothetical protein